MTGCVINDEQGGFREEKGCVNQIFILKQIGEKARENKRRVFYRFIGFYRFYRFGEGIR